MSRFGAQDARQTPAVDDEASLYVGESLRFTFSFADYLNRTGLTMSSIASTQTDPTIIDVINPSGSGGVYTWNASALKAGETNLIITMTTSDANRKPVAVVKFNVHDPKQV